MLLKRSGFNFHFLDDQDESDFLVSSPDSDFEITAHVIDNVLYVNESVNTPQVLAVSTPRGNENANRRMTQKILVARIPKRLSPSLDDKTTSDGQNLPVPRPLLSSGSPMEIDDCITVRRTPEIIQSSEEEDLERPQAIQAGIGSRKQKVR